MSLLLLAPRISAAVTLTVSAGSVTVGGNVPLIDTESSGILGNDYGDHALSAVLVSSMPSNEGVLTLYSNGAFIFTPAAGFHGTTSFVYRARDTVAVPTLDSTDTTVTIIVQQDFIGVVTAGSLALTSQAPTLVTTKTFAGVVLVGSVTIGAQVPLYSNGVTFGGTALSGTLALTSQAPTLSTGQAFVGTVLVGSLLPGSGSPILFAGSNFVVVVTAGQVAIGSAIPFLQIGGGFEGTALSGSMTIGSGNASMTRGQNMVALAGFLELFGTSGLAMSVFVFTPGVRAVWILE